MFDAPCITPHEAEVLRDGLGDSLLRLTPCVVRSADAWAASLGYQALRGQRFGDDARFGARDQVVLELLLGVLPLPVVGAVSHRSACGRVGNFLDDGL